MKVDYQFVTIGLSSNFRQTVTNTLLQRVEDLGIDRTAIDLLDDTNYFEKHGYGLQLKKRANSGQPSLTGFHYEDVRSYRKSLMRSPVLFVLC